MATNAKNGKKQALKKIAGIQERLIAQTERELRAVIASKLKPIRTFLYVNKEHLEEGVCTDSVSVLKTVEEQLFAHLQIKWAQDGIDELVEYQEEQDSKFAKRAARRLRGRHRSEGEDEDYDDEEDEKDYDDDYNRVPKKKKKKYVPERLINYVIKEKQNE